MTKVVHVNAPRLRVFAGPNGSGKSTIINAMRSPQFNGRPISFGVYINADDIAKTLRESSFSLVLYKLDSLNKDELLNFANSAGLLTNNDRLLYLADSFTITGKHLHLYDKSESEVLAQIIARYLRNYLLQANERFSFETVFSHTSNIDTIIQAAEAGYKVYLYFVATESPEVNKYRVLNRVNQDGHAVPEDKIESRYYRSLELMHEAAQHAYQAYFFDNSGENYKQVAHFKVENGVKVWDDMNSTELPGWFIKYYLNKQ